MAQVRVTQVGLNSKRLTRGQHGFNTAEYLTRRLHGGLGRSLISRNAYFSVAIRCSLPVVCWFVDGIQGLVRSWTVEPCIQHWCEDGVVRTNDLKMNCTCPPVSSFCLNQPASYHVLECHPLSKIVWLKRCILLNMDVMQWDVAVCYSWMCRVNCLLRRCFALSAFIKQIFADRVNREGNAIAFFCPSVRPSVSVLAFEPTDLWPWSFACVWVTTMARGRLKLKVTGQGQDAVGLTPILDRGQFLPARRYASACISYRHVSVRPSITRQYCVKTAKRRITKTSHTMAQGL